MCVVRVVCVHVRVCVCAWAVAVVGVACVVRVCVMHTRVLLRVGAQASGACVLRVVGGVRVCARCGLRAGMCACVCVCGGGGGCGVCCARVCFVYACSRGCVRARNGFVRECVGVWWVGCVCVWCGLRACMCVYVRVCGGDGGCGGCVVRVCVCHACVRACMCVGA